MKKKLYLLLVLVVSLLIVYFILAAKNVPQKSLEDVSVNIEEYQKFAELFAEANIGCIDRDGVIDNNVNYNSPEGVSFRYMCNQGTRSTELSNLYDELKIGEISTRKNYIEFNLLDKKENDSKYHLIYLLDGNNIKFREYKNIEQINSSWYRVER